MTVSTWSEKPKTKNKNDSFDGYRFSTRARTHTHADTTHSSRETTVQQKRFTHFPEENNRLGRAHKKMKKRLKLTWKHFIFTFRPFLSLSFSPVSSYSLFRFISCPFSGHFSLVRNRIFSFRRTRKWFAFYWWRWNKNFSRTGAPDLKCEYEGHYRLSPSNSRTHTHRQAHAHSTRRSGCDESIGDVEKNNSPIEINRFRGDKNNEKAK